jgi:hypothetical protein
MFFSIKNSNKGLLIRKIIIFYLSICGAGVSRNTVNGAVKNPKVNVSLKSMKTSMSSFADFLNPISIVRVSGTENNVIVRKVNIYQLLVNQNLSNSNFY